MSKSILGRKEKYFPRSTSWSSSFSLSSATNRQVQNKALKEAGDKLRQVISEVKKDASRLAKHR